ncbi:hypothetical protein RJ639_037255 [Escallonia herrerae]|uniref:Reverse transcriptase/retrotransposon-derived protein RNase H-like domain-containing protein n=1 Tax=Escallonia herrerae TaxID=1293975 RepID=A0AA88X1Z1_9ASTE|nr:hypothetical protein RJ639_037255 [Escallonia herrerae]
MYGSSPYKSIHSFSQLSDLFQKHFISSRSQRKNSTSLLNIVQEKNKSLAYYLGRFNAATLEIDNLDEFVKYTAFLRGLRPTYKFAFSVNRSPPGNIKALLEKANKYIQAKEYLETHRGRCGEWKEEQKKRSQELTPQGRKPTKHFKRDEQHPKDPFALKNLTPLNAKPSQILHKIKDNKALQWPDMMRSRPNKRNKDLWCHFHNDHGHTTDNCGSLKRAIEALIKRNQLRKFVAQKEGRQQTPQAVEEREDQEENAGMINTISGRLAVGGSSGQARKAYARETPHDDPLAITIKAGIFDVKRVLVDNGSSVEVLFYDAFEKMNISTDRLRKMDTPLYEFSNHPVAVKALGRFMAGSAERCLPFFKAIRKAKNFIWTDDCQKLFKELKTYLSFPPLLLKPLPGEDLFPYLSITEVAVSVVLVREEDGIQKPIYYVNKVLQDVETRYPKIDKIALALIISARCLRPYFQSHTIVILMDQPFRKVLLSPEASGRLMVLQRLVAVELESFLSVWKVLLLSMHFALDFKPQITKQNMRLFSRG